MSTLQTDVDIASALLERIGQLGGTWLLWILPYGYPLYQRDGDVLAAGYAASKGATLIGTYDRNSRTEQIATDIDAARC